MSGTGSRKPNIARLGIVCTTLATADERRRKPRTTGREDRQRHANRHRDRRRDRDQQDVLGDAASRAPADA